MDPREEAESIEVSLLLEAIYARYGCDLRGYARAPMRRRVMAALGASGLANLGELQHAVLHDAQTFFEVLNDLTVHVTELFRDPLFYRTFRAEVVPVLRTYPLLRIWHAGCATGEEAYASAILLTEEGLYDRCQIYATDLSTRALAKAKQGIYPARHLEGFTRNYELSGGNATLSHYVTSAYDRVAFKESLRRNILFFQHNLVSDHTFGEMHVIFCRNVLIYFAPELRTTVLARLVQSLCTGGFLCMGNSERASRSSGRNELTELSAEHRIYRYAGAAH